MKCDELYRRLTDHSEGVLSKGVCDAVEAHLAECPTCAALQGDLQDLARLCRETPKERMPDTLRARIQSFLATGA
jgi:predicted anti-sigma-YlaC factor YlaD